MNLRRAFRRLVIIGNVVAPLAAVALLLTGHGLWALAAIMVAHALWLVPTLWPACGWLGEVVTVLPEASGREAGNEVWLTIDDGPDPQDTPVLLDLLDAHEAKATFFFIGQKAAQHPALVREVVRRGHGLGNHTMTHPQFWFWAWGPRAVAREIDACQRELQTASGGVSPRWFRAPAGLKNPWVHEAVEKRGLRLACWSARGLDGVAGTAGAVLRRLDPGIRAGNIILMHEGRSDAAGARLAPQVLGGILEKMQGRGLRGILPEAG